MFPRRIALFFILALLTAFVATNQVVAITNSAPSLDSLSKKRCCLGWREWAKLPELFQERIMVKVDSGAKTSSLHAESIEIYEKDNEEWARFIVHPRRDNKKIKYQLNARVVETKNIRSSNGKLSIRPVINTKISIGGKTWPIEVTLVDRSVMGYRMLLGRTAFSSKFLVDSGKSFVLSEKKVESVSKTQKKNGFFSKSLANFAKIKGSVAGNLFETVIAIVLFLLLRLYVLTVLKNKKFHSPAARARFSVFARNTSIVLLLIALLFIWSNEFKTVSIYLMAISVAVVLMMREVIKNLHGGLLLTSSRPFKIGDRIEVKSVRGEVIDTNFMTTKIAEVGTSGSGNTFNGKVTTVPNSIFLGSPIVNETYRQGYVLHSFVYSMKEGGDWKGREQVFVEVVREVSSEYLEDAKRFFRASGETDSQSKLNFDPSIDYTFSAPERINMRVNMLVPIEKKDAIESRVIKNYLERVHRK